MSSAILLPDRASGKRSPENKKKRMTQLGALGAVEPLSGHVEVVPLPLCPWYLQSVVMYAWYWFRDFARAGVGAALLCVLGTCQTVLL